MTLQCQKGYVIVIFRSPSQSTAKFNEFENLPNFISGLKPSFTIILGNFNARSKSRWPDDITSPKDTEIDSLTTMHGLHQLISFLTHLSGQAKLFILKW